MLDTDPSELRPQLSVVEKLGKAAHVAEGLEEQEFVFSL